MKTNSTLFLPIEAQKEASLKQKIFVFGDLHGCSLELKLILKHLPLTPDSLLVFLGDYVDRGEDAKGVIDEILNLKKKYQVVALKGNHEKMFLDFLQNSQTVEAQSFIFNGGGATLASYAKEGGSYYIPPSHLEFLQSLLLYYETDDYIFVHAGLPDIPIDQLKTGQFESELLWIRGPFFKSNFNWGKLIIHGHSCVEECEVTPKRINLDTGLAYGGKLSVLALPEKRLYSIPKQQPVRHIFLRDPSSQRKAIRFDGNIPVIIHDQQHEFECITVNYSELGMLICRVKEPLLQVWKEGDQVAGFVGPQIQDLIQFEGTVKRIFKKSVGILYAIEFSKTPFEFS